MQEIDLTQIFKNNKLCSHCDKVKSINEFIKKNKCSDCCNKKVDIELIKARRKVNNRKYYLKKSKESPSTYYTPKKRTQEIIN